MSYKAVALFLGDCMLCSICADYPLIHSRITQFLCEKIITLPLAHAPFVHLGRTACAPACTFHRSYPGAFRFGRGIFFFAQARPGVTI